VQNFLDSLKGTPGFGSGQQSQSKLFPLLNDLLETSVTVPMLDQATDEYIDNLLSLLPPTVVVLAQQGEHAGSLETEPTPDDAAAARATMTRKQKRDALEKVLRSPQFSQSLLSLSMALRDGGLPGVSEALGIKVENGGRVRGGNVPLGGGEAIEAFMEGVKKTVQGE
jgi:26S proteasome regulatory subunit N13